MGERADNLRGALEFWGPPYCRNSSASVNGTAVARNSLLLLLCYSMVPQAPGGVVVREGESREPIIYCTG